MNGDVPVIALYAFAALITFIESLHRLRVVLRWFDRRVRPSFQRVILWRLVRNCMIFFCLVVVPAHSYALAYDAYRHYEHLAA